LSPWTPEDECLLRAKFEEYGPWWSILKVLFPNKSALNVKNHSTTMISRQTCNARNTRTTISSEPAHPDSSIPVQTISHRVFIPTVRIHQSFYNNVITLASPVNSAVHAITGSNQSIEQEQKDEHSIDIPGFNSFQNSQFPRSDTFAASSLSYP
jgi:hypothetical protein